MSVEARVREIIADQLAIKESEVIPEAKFIDDLGADSLDLIELAMTLEEKYDMEIPDEDAVKMLTVGDVVAYVESHAAVGRTLHA